MAMAEPRRCRISAISSLARALPSDRIAPPGSPELDAGHIERTLNSDRVYQPEIAAVAGLPRSGPLLPLRALLEEPTPTEVEPVVLSVSGERVDLVRLHGGVDADSGDPLYLGRRDLHDRTARPELDSQAMEDVRLLVAQERFGDAQLVAGGVQNGSPVWS